MARMKKCFVPICGNNSSNSAKIFVTVPYAENIRYEWCQAVGRGFISRASSGRYYCCEDHFDVSKQEFYFNNNKKTCAGYLWLCHKSCQPLYLIKLL